MTHEEMLVFALTSTVFVGALITAIAMSMIAWHTKTERRAERRSNRASRA
jgi:hypothetical protein